MTKEEIYKKQIVPKIKEILDLCQMYDLPFFSVTNVTERENEPTHYRSSVYLNGTPISIGLNFLLAVGLFIPDILLKCPEIIIMSPNIILDTLKNAQVYADDNYKNEIDSTIKKLLGDI